MARGASPEILANSPTAKNKAPLGPDFLKSGQEKQETLNKTRDAFKGGLNLMRNVPAADQQLWPVERQAALKMLNDRQTDTIDAGKTSIDLTLSITDANGRSIQKKIPEGIPMNQLLSFLEDAANRDPDPNSEARQYFDILNKQSQPSTELEDSRYPGNDKDKWISERIKQEAYFRSQDARGKDASGAPLSQAQLEADAKADLANRKELILPELNPDEEKAVAQHEEDLRIVQESADLATLVPGFTRLMVEGVANHKEASAIIMSKGMEIVSNNTLPDSYRSASADVLETMLLIKRSEVQRRRRSKTTREEVAAINNQITAIENQRKTMANAPKGNAASGIARMWGADESIYSADYIKDRPDLVISDYIDKVIKNETVLAGDTTVNVREKYLASFRNQAYNDRVQELGPGFPPSPEVDAAAKKYADEQEKKAKWMLKRENVKNKVLGGSGPAAVMALMMFGKFIKNLGSLVGGADGQQQAQSAF